MSTDNQESTAARGVIFTGLALIVLLLVVSLGLVYQGGAYGPSTWLPLLIGVGALGLVVAIAGPAVRPNRAQKITLAVFALQAVWTATSVFWADSQENAWQETNRTIFYALTLMLIFSAVRWTGVSGLKAVASVVLAVAVVVTSTILVRLGVDSNPESMFLQGRLYYPITYFNGLAALLMVGFWLALGVANGARAKTRPAAEIGHTGNTAEGADTLISDDSGEAEAADEIEQADERKPISRVDWRHSLSRREDRVPRWAQGLLLVLAVVFAEVALLPQSRGALWTFFLVIPFFVILSPHRFRAIVDLGVVAVPIVLFWNSLNGPYLALTDGGSLDSAIASYLIALGYSAAMVLGIWAVTWLVEHLIGPLRRRAVVWASVALASVAILAAAGGLVYADMRTNGIDDYVIDRWHEFTSDEASQAEGTSRFTALALNGRLGTWELAYDAFLESPATGLGAQNFEDYFYQHREQVFTLRQPHSLPMRLLSELGVPGIALWVIFLVTVFVRATAIRFRSSSRGQQVFLAAITVGALSWLIHSSIDWLWQLAGVTLPVMILMGSMIGANKESDSVGASTHADATFDKEDFEESSREGADESVERADDGHRDSHRRSPWPSRLVRTAAVLFTLGAIASAAFPYLSSRYSAMAAGAADLERAQQRADTAAWLNPVSTEPYTALVTVYRTAALEESNTSDQVDRLRSAVTALQKAIEIEPTNWVLQYQTADILIRARDAARAAGLFSVVQELDTQARAYLEEARRLNPLSREIEQLEKAL